MGIFSNTQGDAPYINMAVDLGLEMPTLSSPRSTGRKSSSSDTDEDMKFKALPGQQNMLYNLKMMAQNYSTQASQLTEMALRQSGNDPYKAANHPLFKKAQQYNQAAMQAEKEFNVGRPIAEKNIESKEAIKKEYQDKGMWNNYWTDEAGNRQAVIVVKDDKGNKKPVRAVRSINSDDFVYEDKEQDENGNIHVVQKTINKSDKNLVYSKYVTYKDQFEGYDALTKDEHTGYFADVKGAITWDKKALGEVMNIALNDVKANKVAGVDPKQLFKWGDDITMHTLNVEDNLNQISAFAQEIMTRLETNPDAKRQLLQNYYEDQDKVYNTNKKLTDIYAELKKNNPKLSEEQLQNVMDAEGYYADDKGNAFKKVATTFDKYAVDYATSYGKPSKYVKQDSDKFRLTSGSAAIADALKDKTELSYWETSLQGEGTEYGLSTTPNEYDSDTTKGNMSYGQWVANKNSKETSGANKYLSADLAELIKDMKGRTLYPIEWDWNDWVRYLKMAGFSIIDNPGSNSGKSVVLSKKGLYFIKDQEGMDKSIGGEVAKYLKDKFTNQNGNISYNENTARYVRKKNIVEDHKYDVAGREVKTLYGNSGVKFNIPTRLTNQAILFDPQTYVMNNGVEGNNGKVETKETMIYGQIAVTEDVYKEMEKEGKVNETENIQKVTMPEDFFNENPQMKGKTIYLIPNRGVEIPSIELAEIGRTKTSKRTRADKYRGYVAFTKSKEITNYSIGN